MLQQDDISPALAEVIATTAKVDRSKVTLDRRFRDEVGIDSLSMIDVAVAIEDRFGISLPDDDLERLSTVGGMLRYVVEKQAKLERS